MKRYLTILSAMVAATICFFTVSLAQNAQSPPGDSVTGSRWARVDFTQYCGRTVGELLDTLGNDYVDCFCGGEPLYGVGCTFKYNDGYIELRPYTYKHIHPKLNDYRLQTPDKGNSPWKMDDFRKEIIGYMEFGFRASKSGAVTRNGSGGDRHTGSGLIYANYIGATIDSLVNDIGYPVTYSQPITEYGWYLGCLFEYSNHITIEARLENRIPIPIDVTNRRQVTEYLLRQRIGYLLIMVGCGNQGDDK